MTYAVPARWRPLADVVSGFEVDSIRIGVALQAPDGDRFAFRGDERFYAASTIKLPVVVELLRQVDRGDLSLDETYPVQWRDVYLGDGTGAKLELSEGVALPLRELMYLVVSMSDNAAANVLIELAGIDNVNETMTELGMHRSELGRRIISRPVYPEEGLRENWTTAVDLRQLIDTILDGRAASPESSVRLIDMLQWQENTNRIGRHFADGPFRWGSKTGSVGNDSHDAGYVRGLEGDLTIAVCTTGFPTWQVAEPAIAEIARVAGIASDLLLCGHAAPA